MKEAFAFLALIAIAVFFAAISLARNTSGDRKNYVSSQITEITYDGCSYVLCPTYCGHAITHKGNCQNHVAKSAEIH